MSPSLLQSQFDTLEEPDWTEDALTVDVADGIGKAELLSPALIRQKIQLFV